MKNIRSLMMVATIGFLFASCSNDPCIVGKWTFLASPFPCGAQIEFEGGGTGQIMIPDCNNNCPDVDVYQRRDFTWTYTESNEQIAINLLADGQQCEQPATFSVGLITGTLVCNGYAATITTPAPVIYTYTLDRN
jgi:hypothetical protein